MADVLIPRRTLNKQEYIKLADVVISGSATTNVDISGLNIGKEEEIVLMSDIFNSTVSNASLSIYANANYTSTNYWLQYLTANGTSVSSARVNSSASSSTKANSGSCIIVNFKLTNNSYILYQNNSTTAYGLPILSLENGYVSATFTATSITSLRISASVANSIGIGSRFTLYKVAQ